MKQESKIIDPKDKSEYQSLSSTVKQCLAVAIPSIVSMVSSFISEVINIAFVGHLGNEAMVAGIGLGNMYLIFFCVSIAFGINSSLSTLVS